MKQQQFGTAGGGKKIIILLGLKSWISTTSPHSMTTVIAGGNPLLVERIDLRHQVAHQQTLVALWERNILIVLQLPRAAVNHAFSMAEIKM